MALLAHRTAGKFFEAALQRRHYAALGRMARDAGSFSDTLYRYMTGKGAYPTRCAVRTPLGRINPTLYSYYDLLTLNEIFFREDYAASPADRVIVDIGSNIGLSALYFLTRSDASRCYLFEPDPRNVERLKGNLSSFASRYVLSDNAVADQTGVVRFGLDVNSGRYGGLNVDFGHFTQVNCVHINSVLKDILKRESQIDILKIDTEGTEIATIAAIDPEYFPKIRKIYIEAEPKEPLHADVFEQKQFGTVYQMKNRAENRGGR